MSGRLPISAQRALGALLVWLVAAPGAARSSAGTKSVVAFLRIWTVSERQDDATWVAAARWPGNLDVAEESRGVFYRFTPAKMQGDKYIGNPEARTAGNCQVLRAGPGIAFVSISSATNSPEDVPRPGDFCDLAVRVPADVYEGVILDLARKAVVLLDNSRAESFTDLATAVALRSEAAQDALLDKMAAEIRETLTRLPNAELWFQRIEKGRYAGRTFKDVMGKCARDDLRAFLGFVRQGPGKYVGTPYQLNEVFATWLLNGSPEGR